jgi:hypothetical protein
MNRMVLLSFLLCLTGIIYSQTYMISGVVKDAEGRTLPGVNVIIHEINIGDASNLKGEYAIKSIGPGDYIIEFSSIGYRSVRRNITVNRNIKLDVILQSEVVTTEQVIVSASKHEQRVS